MAKFDPKQITKGDLSTEIKDIHKRIDDQERSRSLGQAQFGKGGIKVTDKGEILVTDGGKITVESPDDLASPGEIAVRDGGNFIAYRPDGSVGVLIGGLNAGASHTYQGIVVKGSTSDTVNMFNAYVASDGTRFLSAYVDSLVVSTDGSSLIRSTHATNPLTLMSNDSGIWLRSSEGKVWIEHTTTSDGANVNITEAGLIRRSTSSKKYKQDIEELDIDVEDVLKLTPKTWRDKLEVSHDDECESRYVGFIAEDLHENGLGQFVVYSDEDGTPDAISYDRLTAALVPVIKDQHEKIKNLEDRLATIESILWGEETNE